MSILLLVFLQPQTTSVINSCTVSHTCFLPSFSFVSIFRFPFFFFCLNTRCLKMQQSSVVCCQDHNYGAPPPPTPPASPLSQTIIPRMDLNGVVHSSRYHETTEDNSADSDSSSEEDGAVASRCHCSLTPERLLIKCENCRSGIKTWANFLFFFKTLYYCYTQFLIIQVWDFALCSYECLLLQGIGQEERSRGSTQKNGECLGFVFSTFHKFICTFFFFIVQRLRNNDESDPEVSLSVV